MEQKLTINDNYYLLNKDKITYVIFRLKDKTIIYIKGKKRSNKFNFYIYYIEV